jgi:hypothetical protein
MVSSHWVAHQQIKDTWTCLYKYLHSPDHYDGIKERNHDPGTMPTWGLSTGMVDVDLAMSISNMECILTFSAGYLWYCFPQQRWSAHWSSGILLEFAYEPLHSQHKDLGLQTTSQIWILGKWAWATAGTCVQSFQIGLQMIEVMRTLKKYGPQATQIILQVSSLNKIHSSVHSLLQRCDVWAALQTSVWYINIIATLNTNESPLAVHPIGCLFLHQSLAGEIPLPVSLWSHLYKVLCLSSRLLTTRIHSSVHFLL